MLTEAEILRERYEARRKAIMDHISFMEDADEAVRKVQEAREAAVREVQEAAREIQEAAQNVQDVAREAREIARGARERTLVENQINNIRFCERLIGRSETPLDRLATLSLSELTQREQELRTAALKQVGRE